jgi:hypothetical protein
MLTPLTLSLPYVNDVGVGVVEGAEEGVFMDIPVDVVLFEPPCGSFRAT